MNNILVSIVMSIYNVKFDHYSESLKSILNQSYSSFEFIIVLDGDYASEEYINSLCDERIKLLKNKSNKGLAYSLNKAIAYSKGSYIFRMDADDISFPNRIEVQLKYLLSGKKLVSSGVNIIDNSGKTIGRSKVYPFHNFIRNVLMYCFHLNPVIHPTVAGNREIFIKNIYNENLRYAQDVELWFRISKQFKFFFTKEILLYYRAGNIDKEKDLYQKDILKRIKRGI